MIGRDVSMHEFANSSTDALMLHAERIVRPVRALQSRKLRMRTDLLAHLEAAANEEFGTQEGSGNDLQAERRAVEHAKFRLGPPDELTRKLQQTVPAIERVLFAKIPFACALSRMDQRLAPIPGQSGRMTLGHKSILSITANLLCLPLLMTMVSVTTRGKPAGHLALMFFFATIGGLTVLVLSYRFVFLAARAEERFDWRGAMARGAVILALQIAMACLTIFGMVDRQAGAGELAANAAVSVALLGFAGAVGRWVGDLRRPYDGWLNLKIAE